jgi:hypothetical protein
MDAPAAQKEFDEHARDRIRRGLLRYMEQHRIGTPRLRERIMKADKRARELPLSNLQRFLAGTHRTFDTYVGMCRAFLEAEGKSLTPAFGEALALFLRRPEPTLETDGERSGEQALGDLVDKFETRITASSPDVTGAPYSELTFMPGTDKSFVLVDEVVVIPPSSETGRSQRWAYDGVAVAENGFVYVFLRNSITRRPKSYSLTPTGPAEMPVLEGEGFESPAWGRSWTYFKIHLSRPVLGG